MTSGLETNHHHHHHHHHHQSRNRVGRWGTTDDFATSFLHSPPPPVLHCPLGLAELQACPLPDSLETKRHFISHLFRSVWTLSSEFSLSKVVSWLVDRGYSDFSAFSVPEPRSGTTVGQSIQLFLRADTLTSPSHSTLCLRRVARARFLSNTTRFPMVRSKSVTRRTVSDGVSGPLKVVRCGHSLVTMISSIGDRAKWLT